MRGEPDRKCRLLQLTSHIYEFHLLFIGQCWLYEVVMVWIVNGVLMMSCLDPVLKLWSDNGKLT